MVGDRDTETAALIEALELHQAELEAQNVELASTVAELVRSGQAVTAARNRYRSLHELAPVPLISIDEHAVIYDVNRAAVALVNAPREHVLERRIEVFIAETARAEFRRSVRELFASGRMDATVTLLSLGPDTDPREVSIEAVVDDVDGSQIAVLAVTDVTAQRRAEEERAMLADRTREAHRLESLGVLAGGIAHTFNNLLTVIIGGADHVLELARTDPEIVEPIRDVLEAARKAGALSHQMLAYSGMVSEPVQALDLSLVIRDLEPLLRSNASTTNLVIEVGPEALTVIGDEQQLRQVLMALVLNAVEAMAGRAGSVVLTAGSATVSEAALATAAHVGALSAGDYVAVEVRDTGIGMTDATCKRIFDPYFTTKQPGRGLGLAAVRGIVVAHHGAIAIKSAVGQGSEFRLYLRRSANTAPAVTEPNESQRPISGAVLVVDDDAMVQKMLARVIKNLGLQVVSALDGFAGIAAVSDGAPFDLVLMDLTMPGMGGVAAANAIRALRPDLPIVLITGYGEIPPEAGSVFAEMLAKPFDMKKVRALLQRMMLVRKTT